jgi:hypothetical protein
MNLIFLAIYLSMNIVSSSLWSLSRVLREKDIPLNFSPYIIAEILSCWLNIAISQPYRRHIWRLKAFYLWVCHSWSFLEETCFICRQGSIEDRGLLFIGLFRSDEMRLFWSTPPATTLITFFTFKFLISVNYHYYTNISK